MSYIARSAVHPATWEHIQRPGNLYRVNADGFGYECGCRPHPSRPHESFHLCDYHDGYDDGCWSVTAAAALHQATMEET